MLCHEDILSFEEMRMIVEAAAQLGVKKVRLTGGEPLVRRGIVDLTRMISAVDGIEEVVMTTNATLLAPLAKDLKAAGLSRLNISLDTLDPKRYARLSRTGTLADALAGIAAAREAGFTHTKFNAVLLGGLNEDEIRPLAEMAKNEPVDVRFIELMRMGECSRWPTERFAITRYFTRHRLRRDERVRAHLFLQRSPAQGATKPHQVLRDDRPRRAPGHHLAGPYLGHFG